MTVIAAVHDRGETWIAADSWRWQADTIIRHQTKLVFGQGFTIGTTGGVRANQLIGANILGLNRLGADPWVIANAIRDLFKADGFASGGSDRDGHGPLQFGGGILIALPDAMHFVAGTFDVVKIPTGTLYAIGAGGEFAMGAGLAMRPEPPSRRVHLAVEMATELCSSCGGPPLVRLVAPVNGIE